MFEANLLKQDWNRDLPRYWNNHSPFDTHFLNALSITLPDCEKFFIETISSYSKKITDQELLVQVKEFSKQESFHRHVHNQYNNWLSAQGLPVDYLQNDQRKKWEFVNKHFDLRTRLALTMCIEHITVVYAGTFLENAELLNNMHPHFEQIWRWHAYEELEHKSVTVDVWNNLENGVYYKNLVMMFVLPVYMWYVGKNTIYFLNADNQLWKWRTVKDMSRFLFNRDTGLIRKSLVPWFDFMKPTFHPLDHDHTDILQNHQKI